MRAGLFPIKPGSVTGLRACYTSLLTNTPAARESCRQAAEQLARVEDPDQALKMSAGLYAGARAYPAILIGFNSRDLGLSIESVSPQFQDRDVSLPSYTPNQMLAFPLNSRESVHIPDISGLDRKSPIAMLAESHGQRLFSRNSQAGELISDAGVTPRSFPNRFVLGAIPNELPAGGGALLFTPLGPDRVTELAYGFIFEYNAEGPFSPASIREARTLSAFFTLSIAEKIAAGNV